MAQWKPLVTSLTAGSVLATLLSTTAQADVTAAQVWQSWKDLSTSMGQPLTAESEVMSGDTLTVTNITMAADMPDGSMNGTLATVAFRDVGDGTVEVTMAPDYPVTITSQAEGADPVVVTLNIRQTALRMIVSGDEAVMSHALTADEVAVSLGEITGSPEEVDADFTMAFLGVAGTYVTANGDTKQVDTELTADSLTFSVAAKDPATSGTFAMSGSMEAISTSSAALFPAGADMADIAAALKAGFAAEGGFTYGKTAYTFDFQDASSNGKATGSAASGSVDFYMDAEALSYGVTSVGTDITVSSSDMPMPEVNAKMAELGFDVTMPLAQGTEPQDFSFVTRIVGLAVSDEVWGMFDPAAVLPRDPATLIIDVAGKANWLVDIFAQDPANPSTEVPGQIHALKLNQLQLTVGGADLTGTGDFTFDNTDMTTFPGMPKPTGKLEAKLVGGNGLIDKLIQMGLLPEEQAMGARMMMGMFASAVEGAEDTLTSVIEMKDDGSIFANGQQIQ